GVRRAAGGAARARGSGEASMSQLRIPPCAQCLDVSGSEGRRAQRAHRGSCSLEQRTLPRRARCRRDRHFARAGFHFGTGVASRPPEADPQAVRVAAAADLRRVPEPAASVGEGPRVFGLPRGAVRQRKVGTRMNRLILALALTLVAGSVWAAADPNKVLRIASADIETLDPHQYNDSPSFD